MLQNKLFVSRNIIFYKYKQTSSQRRHENVSGMLHILFSVIYFILIEIVVCQIREIQVVLGKLSITN